MINLQIFEAFYDEKEIKHEHKRNTALSFKLTKDRVGRITKIDKPDNVRFPYTIGQFLNRSFESWACNNHYLIDGKDTCPDKKIFGVKTKDVPQGHEWRNVFPNKFR